MLNTNDLTPVIGTEIFTDLATLLSGSAAGEIRELLERRGVLVFRGIRLSDEQQLAFTETLGAAGIGGVYKVTFDEGANPIPADYNYGSFSWHIDRTDLDVPPRASILSPRKLSPPGTGNTEFANTYAAYEDLPEAEKRMLENLRVIYRVEAGYREFVPNPTPEQSQRWRAHAPKTHPIIWHHRSGRKSLLTSINADEVIGMDRAAGDALLRRLVAWATQPGYVYSHTWRPDDLLMWDNTGTMHRVTQYDVNCGRRLHRTTLLGEEPIDPGYDMAKVA